MIKNILFIFLVLLYSKSSLANNIKIISDKLEIVRSKNVSIFSGKVYALEDNMKIWSDELILTSSKDEKTIKRINAKNNVKILREQLSIIGDEAVYDPLKNELTVIGEVKVSENDNIILCDEIIIDLENSSSIMKSETTRRVEAIIISED